VYIEESGLSDWIIHVTSFGACPRKNSHQWNAHQ
ncbi:hypothetical protein GCK32_009013, partial [Trichostrongylus colubriformis]